MVSKSKINKGLPPDMRNQEAISKGCVLKMRRQKKQLEAIAVEFTRWEVCLMNRYLQER